MKLRPGAPIKGTKIDVAFLGSCTNGRLSDFQEVAKFVKGRKVAAGVKAIAVPGSQIVAIQCEKLGLARRWVLDVPRDEPGQAHRRPAVRKFIQSQLQGPAGKSHRSHDSDESADGGGGGGHGQRGGCARGLRRQFQLT